MWRVFPRPFGHQYAPANFDHRELLMPAALRLHEILPGWQGLRHDYLVRVSDATVDITSNTMTEHKKKAEPCNFTLVKQGRRHDRGWLDHRRGRAHSRRDSIRFCLGDSPPHGCCGGIRRDVGGRRGVSIAMSLKRMPSGIRW